MTNAEPLVCPTVRPLHHVARGACGSHGASRRAGRAARTGDCRAQAAQVFSNLGRALASVGATFGDVMKTTTCITDVRNLGMLREAHARYFDSTRPPANTLIPVAALARPELLLESEAVVEIRPGSRS